MAKQIQMAKIVCNGEIRVIRFMYVDHPYRVIKTWHEDGKKKTKQLYRSNTYDGAMRFIWRHIEDNYVER